MDSAQPGWHFRLMALTYTFRDALLPRERILEEAGIKPGMRLLDYGCGPGSYVLPAARLVGESGRVYALDIHPMAIRSVNKIAARERLANVETILSDCDTGLPDAEVEVVLFYDVLHDLGDPDAVLRELHRVLTPDGTLSVRDHHLKQEEILPVVTGSGRFRLREKRRRSYAFVPVRQ